MTGRDFVARFLKRHPGLFLLKPKAVSINRVFGLNRTSIDIYFDTSFYRMKYLNVMKVVWYVSTNL